MCVHAKIIYRVLVCILQSVWCMILIQYIGSFLAYVKELEEDRMYHAQKIARENEEVREQLWQKTARENEKLKERLEEMDREKEKLLIEKMARENEELKEKGRTRS